MTSKTIKPLSGSSQVINRILLGTILFFIILIRLRLLEIPLERDEGEYAYMAQLLLKGHTPYTLAYNMKYPGVSFIYAVFISVFGSTVSSVHFCLLVTNLINICFVYLLGKKILGATEGLIASAIFGVLSVSQYYLGFAAHATHFVLLFALPGLYLYLLAERSKKQSFYFFSGLLLGFSILMKQSGLFFSLLPFIFIGLGFFKRTFDFKILGYYGFGLVLPISLLMCYIYLAGNFANFWFWTNTYLIEYGSKLTFKTGLEYLLREVKSQIISFPVICVLFVFGLITLGFAKKIEMSNRAWLIIFYLVSFLTVIPGFYFRSHYFITFLPAFSICIASLYYFAKTEVSKPYWFKLVSLTLIAIGIINTVVYQKDYLFVNAPKEISRKIYGLNPFIESLEIAKYIKKNTSLNDKIAVICSEPQIYFYSDRISATGFIYMYDLMQSHPYAKNMQDQMIAEIEKNKPQIIVYCTIPSSWQRNELSNTSLFSWFYNYTGVNYDKVGVFEFNDNISPKTIWNDQALSYTEKSEYHINIFKLK